MLLIACAGPGEDPSSEAVSNLVVEVDPTVPTLVRVGWSSVSERPARVRWRTADAEGGTAPDAGGTAHAHAFLGIPAGETAALEVVEETDTGDAVVAEAEVTLAPAPSRVPEITVVQPPSAPPTDYLLVSSADLETLEAVAQIVDWKGRPIWWRPESGITNPFAALSLDGSGLLYGGNPVDEGIGGIAHLRWDGSEERLGLEGVHHEIHPRADGAIGACVPEVRELDGVSASVDTLVVRYPDGTTETKWDALPWYEPTLATRCEALKLPNGAVDATHCNGIAFDEVRQEWIVSLYCRGVIVGVDDATGTQVWAIGNADTSLRLPEEAEFVTAHSPRMVGDELWFFDNGSYADGSRSVAVRVDGASGEVAFLREWAGPTERYTPALGSVNPYGDGALVTFGVGGGGFWHDAGGAVLGELAIESPAAFVSIVGVDLPTP